jgi:excisionase family DNA binding protein
MSKSFVIFQTLRRSNFRGGEPPLDPLLIDSSLSLNEWKAHLGHPATNSYLQRTGFGAFLVDLFHLKAYMSKVSIGYRPETVIGTPFPPEDLPVAHIMTTKELSQYLKVHEITICKYATAGLIPAIRIGRIWRFDKDVVDEWIRLGHDQVRAHGKSRGKSGVGGSRKNTSKGSKV